MGHVVSRGSITAVIVAGLCVTSLLVGGALLESGSSASVGIGGPPGEESGSQTDSPGERADSLGSGQGGNQSNDQAGGEGARATAGEYSLGPVERPYFRTASYDTYTGNSWQATGTERPYDGPRSGPRYNSTRTQYEIEVRAANTLIPAPWQPIAVDDAVASDTAVRSDGSFVATTSHDPTETFVVTSDVPEWNEEDLAAAEAEYPDYVEQRYTDLPDDTPQRLVAHTDDVTAEAETPYETAILVERWLKENKEYTLDAGAESDQVADEFVFEMDAAYCQYFATAMTAMLRTQDIPARYVTGFDPGAPNADGEYVVRGANAHAWVEVYVEGVGWVKFDPTPPARDAARDVTVATESTQERVGAATARAVRDEHTDPDDWRPTEADVDFRDEPIPGTTVTVEVTDGGEPLADHRVSFNDEPIGVTDANGRVTGEVPYTEELAVLVEEPLTDDPPAPEDQEEEDEEETGGEPATGNETESEPGSEPAGAQPPDGAGDIVDHVAVEDEEPIGGPIEGLNREVRFVATPLDDDQDSAGETTTGSTRQVEPQTTADATALSDTQFAAPVALDGDGQPLQNHTEQVTRVPVETDIDVRTSGASIPGESLAIRATIEGVPVADATVRISAAGDRESPLTTAETDADGEATVTAPYHSDLVVTVERGDAAGESTHQLRTDAEVEIPDDPTAGQSMTVRATIDDTPVAGLPVSVAGIRYGETDRTGQVSVDVPFESSVEVVAERGDVRAVQSVSPDLTLAVGTSGLPIPGTGLTVTATASGEPVGDAVVTVDGTDVARTDTNGTATVGLPLTPQPAAEVRVVRGDAQATTTVSLLPAWLGAVGLALTGLVTVVWRYDIPAAAQAGASRVRLLARRLVSRVLAGATLLRRGVLSVSAFARRLVTDTLSTLRWAATQLRQRGIAAVTTVPTAVVARLGAVRETLAGLDGRALLSRLVTRQFWRSRLGLARSSDADRTVGSDEHGEATSATTRLLRVWHRLVARVGATGSDSPAEIADRAVQRGLPADPVRQITDAFRRFRYGDGEFDAERVERASSRLDRTEEND